MQEQRKMLKRMLEREARGKPLLENYIKAAMQVMDLGDEMGLTDVAILVLKNYLRGGNEDDLIAAYDMLRRSIELMKESR